MARNYDFLVEKGSKYYCLLKEKKKNDGEISEQTYKTYCKYEQIKKLSYLESLRERKKMMLYGC